MGNRIKTVQRADLALSELATVYGCCGLFDRCTDQDLMSLSFEGRNAFLDWLGWQPATDCVERKGFINYIRPEQSGGACTEGYVSDPCEDPHGIEFGVCEFILEDFGRLRREGPVREAPRNGLRYCQYQPRYRLDGSMITDDREFDMRAATEVVIQDLKRMVIVGNAATDGQFDGLQQSVKLNYADPSGRRCESMDSIIVDWNGNGMGDLEAGHGATWNGNALAAGYNLVGILLAMFRRVRDRIDMAPALGDLSVGDIVLVMPTALTRCLLDSYTCWSVCPGQQYNEVSGDTRIALNNYRDRLNGGMFGFGRIYLDGFEIPLIGYNWGLIQGPTQGDIYMLTGRVGNIRTLNGQYLDMRGALRGYPEAQYAYTDGGRLLTWVERDHTCVKLVVEMQPRILNWAPWAQGRIEDVRCEVPGGYLSADPCETSFFPESSFSVAACP